MNLDPPVTDDNLNQIVAQELQNLALKEAVDSEILNIASEQAVTDEESKLKQAINEELYHLVLKHAISEALEGKFSMQAIHEGEELQYQLLKQVIGEGLDCHPLKSSQALDKEAYHEENPERCGVLGENEANGKGLGHEEEPKKFRVLEEDETDEEDLGHKEDDTKDRNEIEYGNDCNEVKEDDYEDKSSEKEEIENKDGNVGGDTEEAVDSEDGETRRYHYPLRPDAEDCSYYMRTGMCKFGSNCKFNHPLKMKHQFLQAAKETVKQKEENSNRPGQIECKYYLSSGGCKYGKACKYNHSRGRTEVNLNVESNFMGLPIRLGEKECPYYMRTGSCKYGLDCRFNHPDPTAVGGDPPAGYGNGGSVSLQGASQTTMSSWSSSRTLNETAPFVPMMYSPSQGIHSPNTEWNGYQAPAYPTSERSLPTPPAFSINNPLTDTNLYTHHQQQMLLGEFPERPGQPECSYFLKTGDCKYRSACKFHHPKNRYPKTSPSVLSDKGLPLRPDQNICTHYSRYGICKYGPACKYDHPVNYSNSAPAGGSGSDGARMAVEPEWIL